MVHWHGDSNTIALKQSRSAAKESPSLPPMIWSFFLHDSINFGCESHRLACICVFQVHIHVLLFDQSTVSLSMSDGFTGVRSVEADAKHGNLVGEDDRRHAIPFAFCC